MGSSAGQVVPHLPQFVGSVERFAHVAVAPVPHVVSGGLQGPPPSFVPLPPASLEPVVTVPLLPLLLLPLLRLLPLWLLPLLPLVPVVPS